jgi:hypothetical protein
MDEQRRLKEAFLLHYSLTLPSAWAGQTSFQWV